MSELAHEAARQVEADGRTWTGVNDGNGVLAFRGIPYAAAPVGALRWRPPTPVPTNVTGGPASSFGPACPQTDRLNKYLGLIAESFGHDREAADVDRLGTVNEDCLHLSVWTPSLDRDRRLPVMFSIHGGGNTAGWGHMEMLQGQHLAGKGVVVVSINYRLGVLGFLAHPALSAESDPCSSGNYALLDQIAALKWVQRNIARFGGDPDRVTIFGESAGSGVVAYLLTSPLARGLFHRAIMQSGAPMIGPTPSLQDCERQGVDLARKLKVFPDDPASGGAIAALRAIDAMDLVNRAEELPGAYTALVPADGWFLPEPLIETWRGGRQANVPLIVGSNADELTALPRMWPDIEPTLAGWEAFVRAKYGPAAEAILRLYPVANDGEVHSAMIELLTDVTFTSPSRHTAILHAKAGNRTYQYAFTRIRRGLGGEKLRAYHGADLHYVFDTHPSYIPMEDADVSLTDIMMTYWVRFAATGNPNEPTLPNWPPFSAKDKSYMDLGSAPEVGTKFRGDRCDFLDAVFRPSPVIPE